MNKTREDWVDIYEESLEQMKPIIPSEEDAKEFIQKESKDGNAIMDSMKMYYWIRQYVIRNKK